MSSARLTAGTTRPIANPSRRRPAATAGCPQPRSSARIPTSADRRVTVDAGRRPLVPFASLSVYRTHFGMSNIPRRWRSPLSDRSARPSSSELLTGLGLPGGDLHQLPPSGRTFPDGAHYRVEIPSVEGPRCVEAVLEESARLDVPVTRMSQGTGIGLLTDAEIRAMVDLVAGAGVELSLFARPSAGWDASVMSLAPAGGILAPTSRGQDQMAAVVDEIRRA